MRTIEVGERRARLGIRHRLAQGHHADDVVDATRSMVCLHATDPSTVYLSARARVPNMTREDLDEALYTSRELVKHLAMRRTLFVFTRDLLGPAVAGPGARVADEQRRRTIREVENSGLTDGGAKLVADGEAAALSALCGGRELTSSELRASSRLLGATFKAGSGKWAAELPLVSRVLTILSASGLVVRSSNQGAWNTSRPRWAAMADWLGEAPRVPSEDEGTATLVRAWLRTFGPGTATDIKWWLGSTVAAVRRALRNVGAVAVDLDGETGYLLPDDVDPVADPQPWAALLPALDPTTMGWAERDWYLGPHRRQLFDSNGNGGPTAWWNGRIVGGWHQEPSGEVVLHLLEDVGAEATEALSLEAQRLFDWLGGVSVLPRFPSPLFAATRRHR